MATIRVAFLPDNSVLLSVAEGMDYAQAESKIQEIVAELNLDGFEVKVEGKIEQHKHDGRTVEVSGRQHAH